MSVINDNVVLCIDMILYCPSCGTQHIDQEDLQAGWNNPPHRSHLCAHCGSVWRPADVYTNGVEKIYTAGMDDCLVPAVGDESTVEGLTQIVRSLRRTITMTLFEGKCVCPVGSPHVHYAGCPVLLKGKQVPQPPQTKGVFLGMPIIEANGDWADAMASSSKAADDLSAAFLKAFQTQKPLKESLDEHFK